MLEFDDNFNPDHYNNSNKRSKSKSNDHMDGGDHEDDNSGNKKMLEPYLDNEYVTNQVPRCQAHSKKSGEQCQRPASPGTNVCKFHGAGAPQVKKKAALRLAELVDPAIGTLQSEMENAPKSTDRLKAANSILDRAGMSRTQQIESADARQLLIKRLVQLKQEQSEDDLPEMEDAETEAIRDQIEMDSKPDQMDTDHDDDQDLVIYQSNE